MITGIGIDSVEIERFINWANYDQESLKKTLNPEEIEYCLENKIKSPERFASRFAAKEAFYKAFCQMYPEHNTPFLTICHNTSVEQQESGRPKLLINWENILSKAANNNQQDATKNNKSSIAQENISNNCKKPNIKSHISITHTKNTATVIVILENL